MTDWSCNSSTCFCQVEAPFSSFILIISLSFTPPPSPSPKVSKHNTEWQKLKHQGHIVWQCHVPPLGELDMTWPVDCQTSSLWVNQGDGGSSGTSNGPWADLHARTRWVKGWVRLTMGPLLGLSILVSASPSRDTWSQTPRCYFWYLPLRTLTPHHHIQLITTSCPFFFFLSSLPLH